jgi:hypothetical protein
MGYAQAPQCFIAKDGLFHEKLLLGLESMFVLEKMKNLNLESFSVR